MLTTLLVIVSLLLSLLYVGFLLWCLWGWKRLAEEKPAHLSGNTSVSVIIAVRNESANISACLQAIQRQNYPSALVEIIVVDDHSEDDTLAQIDTFELAHLQLVKLQEHRGKKAAITEGIAYARGELIVTTDGDCVMGPYWLDSLVAYYEKHRPKAMAGPVALQGENGWWDYWQSLDLIGLMAITGGSIRNGLPLMCNGANLAYPKAIFEEVGGFKGIDGIPTGDDILLLLKINESYPGQIGYVQAQEAIVYTAPQAGLKALFQQRLRWVSKSTTFSDKRITAILIIAYLFNLMIAATAVAGFFHTELWNLSLLLLLLRMFAEWPLLAAAARFFGKRKLMLYVPAAQLVHVVYVLLVGVLAGELSYRWKGRRY